jgi:hypothetical protein
MKKLYKFNYTVEDYDDCLYGTYILDDEILKQAIYYWKKECCGWSDHNFSEVTDDQNFIKKFEELDLESGFNPIMEYLEYIKR